MSRGERLTHYMDKKGFTARDLSRASGVAYTTIRSMIERDLSNASIDNTIKICKALGIKVEDILNVDNANVVAEDVAPYATRASYFSYRFYPATVSAGEPSIVEGVDAQRINIPNLIMGKYAANEDIFFLRVNGESMNLVIPHDSLIAIKRIEITELKNEDVVVFSNGHEYSVKRYFNDTENKRHIFRSESTDKSFVDHTVDYEDVGELTIHGKVVMYIVSTD